jgi:hypothetical protein
MTGLGLTQQNICGLLDIDEKTLRKHFRRELDSGAAEANLRVAQSLYNLATKDRNVTACIWWTKARMGWKDQTEPLGGQSITLMHLIAAKEVSAHIAAIMQGKAEPSTIEGTPAVQPSSQAQPADEPPDLLEPAKE